MQGWIGLGLTPNEKKILSYAVFFLAACWYGRPLAAALSDRPLPFLILGGGLFGLFGSLNQDFCAAVCGVLFAAACSVLIHRHGAALREGLTWIGRRSLEIYILHYGILGIILVLARDLPKVEFWLVPGTALAAIVLSIALKGALDKMAPWLFAVPQGLRAAHPKRAVPLPTQAGDPP